MFSLEDLHYVKQDEAPYPPSPGLAEAMSELTDDGDTFDLADGLSLLLTICQDEDYSVNDYDGDGMVEWSRNSVYGPSRPDHFDGTARIIDRDRGSSLWWQPPGPDMIGDVPWSADEMRKQEARISDLVTYGFSIIGLTLRETLKDSTGSDRVVAVDYVNLGGVDAMYPELIGELLSELQANRAGNR